MFKDVQRNKIRSLESQLEKSELYVHYIISQLKVEHAKQERLAAEKKELKAQIELLQETHKRELIGLKEVVGPSKPRSSLLGASNSSS